MNSEKPFLFVLGTRPEGIKLLPLVWEFQQRKRNYEILHTNQHTELLDTLLQTHEISPHHRLGTHPNPLCTAKQSMLAQMEITLDATQYSAVIVQGDTLSALCGAEYGFFHRLPVLHIEAGMRTYRRENPYPEEIFRRMIAPMATLHFCPSEDEAQNLRREGICEDSVFVTGNTFPDYWNRVKIPEIPKKKQILITIHRRENLPFLERIFGEIARLANENGAYDFLFPLHPNPTILACAESHLSHIANLRLIPPLPPEDFYRELRASEMVLTDSGGVQEECIFLGKKVLVVREVSERCTEFPFARIVSPEGELQASSQELLHVRLPETPSPYYGIGGAAKKIAKILESRF